MMQESGSATDSFFSCTFDAQFSLCTLMHLFWLKASICLGFYLLMACGFLDFIL